jgi:uncharacterized protein YxjI
VLERNRFVVREQVKLLTDRNTYAILDADAGAQVGTAEEQIGLTKRLLRWFISKALLPTRVEVREKPDDSLVFTIRRGAYILRSRVEVLDAQGELVGFFMSKVLTLGGGFHVYDKAGNHFAEVTGKWHGFDYRFVTPDGKVELGRVSKQWGGLAKELFTSADTYGVEVGTELAEQPLAKMLILAAALAIDTIYKEESRTVDPSDLVE